MNYIWGFELTKYLELVCSGVCLDSIANKPYNMVANGMPWVAIYNLRQAIILDCRERNFY